MILEHPWFLLLLLTLPLLAFRMFSKSRLAYVKFSSTILFGEIRPSWRQRFVWLPEVLMLVALATMIVALARPRMGREQTIIDTEGIAMEIVVDRSSSMEAMDFQIDGRRVDRLTAIKNVATEFVLGDKEERGDEELNGRMSDLIGLISFAGYADPISPPTLDHVYLMSQLDRTEIVNQESEDGTAIGDAISLAVEKLQSLDTAGKSDVKSKVVILMTDGENTAGEIEPVQAAELAKAMGIKVYTIGVGTNGLAPYPVMSPFRREPSIQMMEVRIDEATLGKIAETTGGQYFRATDTKSLKAIYEAIDKLEKTKIESHRFTDYRELAVQSFAWHGLSFPPIVAVSLFLLVASLMAKHLVFRVLV